MNELKSQTIEIPGIDRNILNGRMAQPLSTDVTIAKQNIVEKKKKIIPDKKENFFFLFGSSRDGAYREEV